MKAVPAPEAAASASRRCAGEETECADGKESAGKERERERFNVRNESGFCYIEVNLYKAWTKMHNDGAEDVMLRLTALIPRRSLF